MKNILPFIILILACVTTSAVINYLNYQRTLKATKALNYSSESFFSVKTVGGNGVLTFDSKVFTGSKQQLEKIADKLNFPLEHQPENNLAIILSTWSPNLKRGVYGLFIKINDKWERVVASTKDNLVIIKELRVKEKGGRWYLRYKAYQENIDGTIKYIGDGEFIRDKTWKYPTPGSDDDSQEKIDKTSYS